MGREVPGAHRIRFGCVYAFQTLCASAITHSVLRPPYGDQWGSIAVEPHSRYLAADGGIVNLGYAKGHFLAAGLDSCRRPPPQPFISG